MENEISTFVASAVIKTSLVFSRCFAVYVKETNSNACCILNLSRSDLWHNCILAFSWPQPPSLLKLPHKCSRRFDPGKLGTNQMVRAIVGFQVLSASKPFGPTDTADYISNSSKAKSILTAFISIFSVIFFSRVPGGA